MRYLAYRCQFTTTLHIKMGLQMRSPKFFLFFNSLKTKLLNGQVSNLLLILSVNNPTDMYLSDLRVYFRVTLSGMEEY